MSDEDIPPLDPKAYITSHAYIHHRPTDARQVILDLTRERDEARAEVERLREALAWYGTRVSKLSGADPFAACSALMNDQGERARKALEGAP